MTVVRTTYRDKRPPKKRRAAALEVPAVVMAAEPATASKRAKSVMWTDFAATAAASDAVPSSDRVAPSSAIVTIHRRKHVMLAHLLEDQTPEEFQRRGDAANALFREVVRRATGKKRP
jgi:hypothetical protein